MWLQDQLGNGWPREWLDETGEELGWSQKWSDNTYNYDSPWLDNTYQIHLLESPDGEFYVVVIPHMGGDVRGNYGDNHVFGPVEEYVDGMDTGEDAISVGTEDGDSEAGSVVYSSLYDDPPSYIAMAPDVTDIEELWNPEKGLWIRPGDRVPKDWVILEF